MIEKGRYVIDASVLAKVIVKEKNSNKAIKIMERHIKGEILLTAPSLILYEIGNILWKKKMGSKLMYEYIKNILGLGIKIFELDEKIIKNACKIANRNGLTFYDALYIALAIALKTKLITADKKLKNHSILLDEI